MKGTYLSADEVERVEALLTMDYAHLCQHPRELPDPAPGEPLVIDFDHVLFDDRASAVRAAMAAIAAGVPVGVHTYFPDAPRLDPLRAAAKGEGRVVAFGRTHGEAASELVRLLHARAATVAEPAPVDADGRAATPAEPSAVKA